MTQPRLTDNDAGEISVTLDSRELRGWSYAGDAERRTKMLAAREYVEGWCDATERSRPVTAGPGWHDGAPPKPWSLEWFIAETTYGDRVVLVALPDEWSHDFKTTDETYLKRDLIKRWMQFPDSEFISPAPPAAAGREEIKQILTKYFWTGEPGEHDALKEATEALLRLSGPAAWKKLTDLWQAIAGGLEPRCRDCADFNGRCQGNGLPCDPQERALEQIAKLRAASTLSPHEHCAWQPIEMAPRDGTRILATGGGLLQEIAVTWYVIEVGAWATAEYTLDDRDNEADRYSRPTLWQPLPALALPRAERGTGS